MKNIFLMKICLFIINHPFILFGTILLSWILFCIFIMGITNLFYLPKLVMWFEYIGKEGRYESIGYYAPLNQYYWWRREQKKLKGKEIKYVKF